MSSIKKNLPLPISIVILSYNLLGDLKKNLTYLLKSRHFVNEYEIIVVDNNSNDGSKEYLSEMKVRFPELQLILHDSNKGCGGGRNSGWKIAQNEYILSIDHDAFISVENIRKIPSLFNNLPHVGIMGFKIVHQLTGDLQNPHGDKICEVANFHGAGFAIRQNIFTKIGGMDDEVVYGADELELSIKFHSDGWKIYYIPEIIVYHNNIIRDEKEELFRANGYLYGNIRLLYKFFPKTMAFRNSVRYQIIASRVWLFEFGIRSFAQMINTFIKARNDGLSRKQIINKETVAHYNNVVLRPEFGNVPIYFKIYSWIKQGICK